MGKHKMKVLRSMFSSRKSAETGHPPLEWASCKRPKTSSFRAAADDDGGMFKTINSVFIDPNVVDFDDHSPEDSWFTSTSESASHHSTESEDPDDKSIEALIRSVRSDRLFFEPHGDKSVVPLFRPFKESVVLAMDSKDPYVDFRTSMEEIVESGGIKEWDSLDELLAWYLRVNRKSNHEIIVEAFVDMLLGLNRGRRRNSNKKDTNVTSFSWVASSFSDDSDSSLKGKK
ncbi:hypothetical protein SAY86_023711 [Trapa natans]|uniref:Transcription repressor n=1 Tax=Trapa natans TaxID=22666 RepID=A0AAN7RAG9_TRANT|nr:hypothetical protein SAY86_023711 [Trapa natans]